ISKIFCGIDTSKASKKAENMSESKDADGIYWLTMVEYISCMSIELKFMKGSNGTEVFVESESLSGDNDAEESLSGDNDAEVNGNIAKSIAKKVNDHNMKEITDD
ncbi:7264_t:CDS:2, partial [Racocetra persica]